MEVERRCVKAEPRHGKLWISIAKKPGNWNLKPDEILRIAHPIAAQKIKIIE